MDFPDPHYRLPSAAHTHTAILLHGRGSDGPEFAEDFLSALTSKGQTLPSCFPGWRWVFPTSRVRWSTTFKEEECSWFDIVSLTNIEARHDLQIEGLRESVSHVLEILDQEVRLLNGQVSRICLGGISQGMATALWVLFCASRRVHSSLGGFLGFCGWMPFAGQLGDIITDDSADQTKQCRVLSFARDTIAEPDDRKAVMEASDKAILSTPVFLSHGTDDPFVSVELGRQASETLQQIMGHVEWSEFADADNDGHWIKEPEGFDRLHAFLEKCS